jgi:hypothetical protein
LSPFVTVLACIYKQLAPQSARDVEDWIAGLQTPPRGDGATSQEADETGSREGDSFCAGRKRLPPPVLENAAQHLGAEATARAARFFYGLWVIIIDATTTRMPRTDLNVKFFGLANNQYKSSTLPLARVLLLVCDGCGAVLNYLVDPYTTSELQQLRVMLPTIQVGALVLLDRGFSSYVVLWSLDASGRYFLARQHQSRSGKKIRKLGKNDALYEWERPRRVSEAWTDVRLGCDARMVVRVITIILQVRGHRDQRVILCTNLLDAEKYPAQELADLYLERWNIELDIRTLKTQHGLDRLTAKSPEIVRKEIDSILLAFNAVRLIMVDAAVTFRRLSHKRARKLLLEKCAEMVLAQTLCLPALYRFMLTLIRQACMRRKKRRSQPRAIIFRKRDWPVLQVSRATWQRTGKIAS